MQFRSFLGVREEQRAGTDEKNGEKPEKVKETKKNKIISAKNRQKEEKYKRILQK
jgi:hypothetical protein